MRSWGTALVATALVLRWPGAPTARSPPRPRRSVETPTRHPHLRRRRRGLRGRAAAGADTATDLTVTDFDQIRLQLGVPDLTGGDPKRERDAFWRQAATEAPLLLGGMLRDDRRPAGAQVRLVAGRRRLGGALRRARGRGLGPQDPRRPADGRHHPRRRRRHRAARRRRGPRGGPPGRPQRRRTTGPRAGGPTPTSWPWWGRPDPRRTCRASASRSTACSVPA